MATDLSSLIQDGLSGTLESLLAKTSTFKEVTKAVSSEFHHKDKFVRVDTTFSFEQLSSKISFFVPALNASSVLNMMMGIDAKPVNEINDDILDAINEVISNICGGLTTTINGSGFADLTNTKYTIDGNSAIKSDVIKEEVNLFKFIVAQEDDELVIYISFEENLLPYIEQITQSAETVHDETLETEEETTEEQSTDEEETPIYKTNDERHPEKILDDTEHSSEIVNTPEEDESEDKPNKLKLILHKLKFPKTDESMDDDEKKQTKLKQLIYIISIVFLTIIITFGILFAIGFFDTEVIVEKKDTNTTAQVPMKHQEITIQTHPKPKQINFSITQINPERLNKKLILLTKFEIIENDKKEKQKLLEKEKLLMEKKKKLEEFASKNKEESISEKKDQNGSINHKVADLKSFVEIPTLQIQLYKDFIKDSKAIHADLSICKDNVGRTHVYIGPFVSKDNRDMLFKTLKSDLRKESKILDISLDDFNQKCKF